MKEDKKKEVKKDKASNKELHNALEQVKVLTKTVQEQQERIVRLSAEIQNLGKRHQDEISNLTKYEGEELIKKILPIVDNFERSIAIDKSVNEKYLEGYKMIYTNTINVLESFGVKEIECEDKEFDPKVMDAILTEKVDGIEPGYVILVLQKGYTYKDKLIRPAMVKVSE